MADSHPIEIIPATSHRRMKDFIDFPHRLYADDPAYVPRLYVQQKEQLSRSNPYFHHSTAGFFVARRERKTVGRIAWFLNANHLLFSGRRQLFFGFFDAVDDQSVADALLAVVFEQARRERCESLLGPIEFSTNDTCGLLIDGFDRRPSILMPFNAYYAARLLTTAGFRMVQELHAYEINTADEPEFLDAVSDHREARLASHGIAVRNMDFSRFDAEVEALYPIYEEVFDQNWGYMPLSHADFVHQAKGLRQISVPDFVLIAEDQGRPIGYAVGIFDANEVFATFRRGRLLPFNILKLRRIPKVSRIKILNLGVIPEYRMMGIDIVMYARIFAAGRRHGLVGAEASYVMGSNVRMKSAIRRLNGTLTKRYAIYQKDLV